MNVPYTIRPIDTWPGEVTRNRKYSPFSASNSDTLDQLDRELHHLGAKSVVMLLAVEERHIRLDGQLRAGARPSHPGVVLAFDSDHGPLKYAVDTFVDAWANIRAIALGLEALRRVDRYGITKRGEQYTGWRQIAASSDTWTPSREGAAEWVATYGGTREPDAGIIAVLLGEDGDAAAAASIVRRRAKVMHPDAGGDADTFRKLQEAREVLGW